MKHFVIAALLCAGCASAPAPTPAPAPKVPDSEQYLPPDIEAISLLGKPLSAPQLAPDVQKKREEDLAQAQREYDANRDSADAAMLLADRLAALGRYREAIGVATEAIQRHPDNPALYRLRGHRHINVRRFHEAVSDLGKAELLERGKRDELERHQILYHLGLAHYLLGDYDRALSAYQRCLAVAKNPDRLVSTSNWMYMTLRRLGRVKEAEKLLEPISVDLDVVENVAYHKLLLMYEGDIAPEELVRQDPNTADGATILYGIGNWSFVNGQPERADPLWQKLLEGTQWFTFGYIAAEAEIARLDKGRRSPSQ